MARAVKQKSAQIELDRIIGPRRTCDFSDEDKDAFAEIVYEIKHHQKIDPNKVEVQLSIDNSSATLTKNQKKKLRKKKSKAPKDDGVEKTQIESIASEIIATFKKPEEKTETVTTSPDGWEYPSALPCDGVIWTASAIKPKAINDMVRSFKGQFSTIRDEDIEGTNVLLFPPTTSSGNITTMIPKAPHGCTSRVIACLGSPEVIKFETTQGKTTAGCDCIVTKDQLLIMSFGVCSSCSFSVNNSRSYLFKMNKNSRGMRRNKNPEKRFIMVVDFISSEDAITSALKKATKNGSNGNEKLQKQLDDKLGVSENATDLVVKAATENAKKKKGKKKRKKKKTTTTITLPDEIPPPYEVVPEEGKNWSIESKEEEKKIETSETQ
jgi:hypothetical protein